MSDSHVLLHRASDRMEASLLAHALESAGIRAKLAGGGSTWFFGAFGPNENLHTDLWVEQDDVARGRDVIEEFRRKAEEASPHPASSWACIECGEANGPNFEVCWNCETPRSVP